MIKISGCSDDLVEIEGDREVEIGAFDKDVLIYLNDGTRIRMTYGDDGAWHGIVEVHGMCGVAIKKLIDRDDYYSDELTVDAVPTGWQVTSRRR